MAIGDYIKVESKAYASLLGTNYKRVGVLNQMIAIKQNEINTVSAESGEVCTEFLAANANTLDNDNVLIHISTYGDVYVYEGTEVPTEIEV